VLAATWDSNPYGNQRWSLFAISPFFFGLVE
jgi:hypothetical protein